MKKLLKIAAVLIGLYSCSENEQSSIELEIHCIEEAGFTICSETLDLKVDGFITNAVLFKEKYYLFLLDTNDRDKMGNQNPVKLYQVSINGLQTKQLNFPEELEQPFFCETQIRNDSLVISSQFDNESFYLNESTLKWSKVKDAHIPIFDDKDYRVTYKCNGEFGGVVSFYDKQKSVYYDALSTCAVVVNKLNDNFYVTTYLGHMASHSEILEISNPRKLYKRTVIPDSKAGYCFSELIKGTKTIFDSWDLIIHTSFIRNNHLYHIYSANGRCYIGELEGGELTKECALDIYPHYEHHVDNNSQLLRFYSKSRFKLSEKFLFGIMEIIDGDIKLHYIRQK